MAVVVRQDREPDDAADRERWVRGAALCERLRAELGQEWQVGRRRYFDGVQHVQWTADGPWEPWSPKPWRRPDEG